MTTEMSDLKLAERARHLVEVVEVLQEASRLARSWTQPGSCGRPPNEMPCQHPECIKWAAYCSAKWAREAFHAAVQIESLVSGPDLLGAVAAEAERRADHCPAMSLASVELRQFANWIKGEVGDRAAPHGD